MKYLSLLLLLTSFAIGQVQENAPWNLARISERNYQYPLSTTYVYNGTGQGVPVYVVDYGILLSHPEFEGRAVKGYGKPLNPSCNNHGTHVAGVIGSRTYGVAKQVTLVSVHVAPCTGYPAATDVIKGLQWIERQPKGVVNISFAGSILNNEVERLASLGFIVVVAAGNYDADACGYWYVPNAIVVGSTDQRDYRDGISNYGPCVDIFAPGVNVLSTWNDGLSGAMSGTSTAAPHISGVAAIYLGSHPFATPQEVKAAILSNATYDILGGGADPNIFIYSL